MTLVAQEQAEGHDLLDPNARRLRPNSVRLKCEALAATKRRPYQLAKPISSSGLFDQEREQRAYVMESGKITLTGTGEELLTNPKVRAAYLGEAEEAA